MFGREIGRVKSVDSFKVIVELDENLKGVQKSGYDDIFEVAKVNSYIIIPIGSDMIVALITRVKTFEDGEFEKMTGGLRFSKSKRHIVATMLGTITDDEYKDGVYNYPVLDNPVWYIKKDELKIIFDDKEIGENEKIDLEKDYYLPIGKNSSFPDYDVKINPDKFFTKHAAILGNTGSGKSCTIASILQSLFEYDYSRVSLENDKEQIETEESSESKGQTKESTKNLKSSTIIIFDTNGEYKEAFKGDERINAFTITEEGMRVPYWLMNYEDFDYLFEPSAGTQAPILKKALGLLKNEVSNETEGLNYNEFQVNKLIELKEVCCQKDFQIRNFIFNYLEDYQKLDIIKNNNEISNLLEEIRIKSNLYPGNNKNFVNGNHPVMLISKLNLEINKVLKKLNNKKIKTYNNIDLPKYFDFRELINRGLDMAIEDVKENQNKYKEYVSGLKLRLAAFMSDVRKQEPLMLSSETIEDSLNIFFQYILGDEKELGDNLFGAYKRKEIKESNKNQVVIIDLSLTPFELLETITALIGRLILEFAQRINKVEGYEKKRGKYPIAIVLEEAQNYIPEIDSNGKKSITKKVFERIAREGRKFGVSLVVSSQRPSELSKTILSQCNSFIVHKLQNPEDQRYIRQIVSSANEDLLNQLPVLAQQHAIIMGEAVRTSSQLRINDITKKPDSHNPKFVENWLKEKNGIEIEKVSRKWLGEKLRDTLQLSFDFDKN